MAIYVVATKRECRGQGRTAIDAISELPETNIIGRSNQDRVVIESHETESQIQSRVGNSYHVERELLHVFSTLDRK